MPRTRKKIRVLNTLPKAQCYGIDPGKTGVLEVWQAKEMIDHLKAGREVPYNYRSPKDLPPEDPAKKETERLTAHLEASEERIRELEAKLEASDE